MSSRRNLRRSFSSTSRSDTFTGQLHIHFIAALIADRPDCAFVIATHEIDLPSAVKTSEILLIRDCEWNEETPAHWIVDQLKSGIIPEGLRRAVLGSRRRILFAEGKEESLDRRLYSLLFPSVSVIAVESSRNVIEAVSGLRESIGLNWTEAHGIIDRDNRPGDRIADLQTRHVYSLDVHSVEALYYCQETIAAVAAVQAKTYGLAALDLERKAIDAALEALSLQVAHLSSRRAEILVRDRVLRAVPKRESMKEAGAVIRIEVDSPYEEEVRQLSQFLKGREFDEIIKRYPIRESRARKAIAIALKCPEPDDYEQIALQCVATEAELRTKLLAKVGLLANALGSG
jgi:hypothetical protein